jgi:hypothetical protein
MIRTTPDLFDTTRRGIVDHGRAPLQKRFSPAALLERLRPLLDSARSPVA